MSNLVVNEKESYVSVAVAAESKPSITLTPPATSKVVVSPQAHQAVTVTQEGSVSVRVLPAGRSTLSVSKPQNEKTLVVTGGRAVKATSVSHLADVDTTGGIFGGSTLIYDDATQKWVAKVDTSLTDHVNSPTPHPAYDSPDGPSLVLLYQNAKV